MKIYLRLNCTGAWVEYTNYIDITKLEYIINLDANNDMQKSISSEIEAHGEAFKFIKTNLIDSVNRYSNSICVKVTNQFNIDKEFKIGNQNLCWCDNGECKILLTLVENNIEYDCIKNTLIADNTLGWFQEYPTPGTIHPRFRYCDVLKPTFWFGVIVTFINSVDFFILSLNMFLNITINPIILAINALLGTNFDTVSIPYLFQSVSGCNRSHPAPFIRTYMDNVCTLCNISTNINSNPIFYDNITPSVYYDLCLLTAYTTKGVDINGNKDYIVNNRPSWTLFDLCSKLKEVFNARWYVVGGILYFERKDKISQLIWGATPMWDISENGTDKINVIDSTCYEYNGQGKLSRLNLKYSQDVSDNIGNEALNRFNGEYISPSNPNYKTPVEKVLLDFGASSYVLDGKDTLYDANLQQAVGTILSGIDYHGSLKTQGDTCGLAKLIIWNGQDMDDARAWAQPYINYLGVSAFSDDVGAYFPITLNDLYNFNNPMSFDPEANLLANNLWSFHTIDTPSSDKKTNIQFEVALNLCEIYLQLDLFQRIILDSNTVGEIFSIKFDYKKNTITIKGDLV